MLHYCIYVKNHFQDELEREKDEKIRHLENQYENSLRSIGQGHREASEQVGQGYIETVKYHTYFIFISTDPYQFKILHDCQKK